MYKFVRIDRDKAKGLGVAFIVSEKPGGDHTDGADFEACCSRSKTAV